MADSVPATVPRLRIAVPMMLLAVTATVASALAASTPRAAAAAPISTTADTGLLVQGPTVGGPTGAVIVLLAVLLTALFHGKSKSKKKSEDQ